MSIYNRIKNIEEKMGQITKDSLLIVFTNDKNPAETSVNIPTDFDRDEGIIVFIDECLRVKPML